MSDDFARVKERIDLLDLVLAESGGKLVGRSGQKDSKVNPCPFCRHNDCFTVYTEERRYNCYSGSCGASGDCFDFIETTKSMDNVAALRYLAGRAGVELSDRPATASGEPSKPKGPSVKSRIWARAVEHYQKQLFSIEAARDYQTLTRKHSADVLREFGVGFSDGKLHQALAGEFSLDDLLASGLVVQNEGKPPRDFFSWGFFVYPHKTSSQSGWLDVGDWTCKPLPGSSERKTGYRLKSDYRDPSCLFLNQSALYGKEFVLVEGQNDLLSVAGKGGVKDVVATCGILTNAQLDELKTVAADRTIYLCFDQDDAGKAYTQKIVTALAEFLIPPRLGISFAQRKTCDLRVINWYSTQKDIDDLLTVMEAA